MKIRLSGTRISRKSSEKILSGFRAVFSHVSPPGRTLSELGVRITPRTSDYPHLFPPHFIHPNSPLANHRFARKSVDLLC